MDLFDFAQYDIAYIAKYSPRPHGCGSFKDDVSMDEKSGVKNINKKLSKSLWRAIKN